MPIFTINLCYNIKAFNTKIFTILIKRYFSPQADSVIVLCLCIQVVIKSQARVRNQCPLRFEYKLTKNGKIIENNINKSLTLLYIIKKIFGSV